MRALAVAALCCLLAACGGDESSSSSGNSGKTYLKVMLYGYEGNAVVGVNRSETHNISGGSVHTLGRYPEGSVVEVELADKDPAYYCWPASWVGLLVDTSQTVIFSCSRQSALNKPIVTGVNLPSEVAINLNNNLYITSMSPQNDPVIGYAIDVISQPEGATFLHQQDLYDISKHLFKADTIGSYTLEVRAISANGSSDPYTVTINAIDPPPEFLQISLAPSRIYTNTDAVAAAVAYDFNDPVVTISYLWSVNNTPIAEITGNTLPASHFSKGDQVSVQIKAEDTNNSILSSKLTRTVSDSPAQLDASNIPQTLSRGTALDIPLLLSDIDGDEISEVSLKYGPAGMEIVDNRLQWHGNPILMSGRGTFHFGISLSDTDTSVEDFDLLVTETSLSTKTYGINDLDADTLKRKDQVLDFDNDGIKEVITYNDFSLSIMEVGESIKEDWAVAAFDYLTDVYSPVIVDATFIPREDARAHVAILTNDILVIDTETGETVAVKSLPDIHDFYSSIHYVAGETLEDGVLVVLLQNSSIVRRLVGLDPKTLEVLWQSVSGNLGNVSMVANIDNDPADEIVTTGGYVFDSQTGANQWLFTNTSSAQIHPLYNESLGYSLGIQDMRSGNMRVIDFNTRSITPIILTALSGAALASGNIDSDADDEVILVKSQEVQTYDYDVVAAATTLTNTFSATYISGTRVLVPDFTADNKAVLISAGTQGVYLRQLQQDATWETLSGTGCESPETYTLATSASDAAQPSNQTIEIGADCRGNSVARISYDVPSGQTSHQLFPGTNLNLAITGLINNDANTDFVYSGVNALSVYDTATEQPVWTITGLNSALELEALDINEDGSKEILRSRYDGIDVYDIMTQSIITQIPHPASGEFINISHSFVDPGTGDRLLAMSSNSRLQLYQLNATAAVLKAQLPLGDIQSILNTDTDGDGSPEIVLQRRQTFRQYIEIYDLDLNFIRSVEVPLAILNLVAVPDSISQGNHLIGVSVTNLYTNRLTEIDLRTGHLTWSGPVLLYRNPMNDLKFINTTEGYRLVGTNRYATVIGW